MTRVSPYPLRMPEDMRDKLEQKSRESGRSLNSEITARLEMSLNENLVIKDLFGPSYDDISNLASVDKTSVSVALKKLVYAGLSELFDDKPSRDDLSLEIERLNIGATNLEFERDSLEQQCYEYHKEINKLKEKLNESQLALQNSTLSLSDSEARISEKLDKIISLISEK